MYTGPKVTNDNLVFGYDTGYGVADNTTATRFYPGEPTTNVLTAANASTTGSWSASNYGGSSLTREFLVEDGIPFMRFTNVTYVSGYPRSTGQVFPGGVTVTGTFSTSFEARGTPGASLKLKIYQNGSTKVHNTATLTDKWTRYTFNNQSTSYNLNQPYFNPNTSNAIYDIRNVQIEAKSHSTPFVSGSRSNTASLIDLKETEAITVANMSFDSTGQPTFDGTNDYIELDDALNSLGNVATFEAVFKATETNNTFRVILGWGNGYNNYSGLHIGSWTGSYTDESLHVGLNSDTLQMFVRKGESFYKDNAFHHVIVTAGQNNYSIWIDGVEETFTFKHGSQSTHFDEIVGYNSNIDSQIGSRPYPTSRGYFKGDIPVVKVYDRILSDTEIKRNYNAYKKRFNI